MNSSGDTVVCTSYNGDLGGGELRLLEHLKFSSLLRQRCAVVVFERGPLVARVKDMGIDVAQIPWSLATPRPWRYLQNVIASQRFLHFLRHQRAGLIFCNTFNDFELIYTRSTRPQIPLILRSRAEAFPYFDQFPSERRRAIVEQLNAGADRILTTTEYDRSTMLAAGIRPEKVYTVLQGVDVSVYENAKKEGTELRRVFGVSKEQTLFGFVARMVPQKGHEVFLEALKCVHNKRPDVRALIVGDAAADGSDPDGYRKFIVDRINQLNLKDVVVLAGFRIDVPAILNSIDIFVHASLKEPFGTVIVEAMGAGKPVIASQTFGPQEIIDNGVTGILTPPGDAVALANAMLQFVNDPELAASFGSRAKGFVMKNFALSRTIHSLDHHISEVLSGCSHPCAS